MVRLREIVEELNLEVPSAGAALDTPVVGGYAADLLSCAMNRARKGYVWVTLQSHVNVVAVASLLGLAAVIITEGGRPDAETIARAEAEGVVLLLTADTTFTVVSGLASLGVQGKPAEQ